MHSSLNENKGLPRTEAVQNELAAILASRTFARSERHRRFLSYIVEKALNSQATDVKEYSIAIEVFDRPSSYDPQVDSLVRVEASKLRSRLQRYYETEGAGHAVRIDIPKGTYLPAFSRPVDDQTATPSTRRWLPFAIAGIAAIGVLGGFGVYTYRMLRYVPIPFQNPQIMRLTELTDVRYAVISPNGQYVAYVRGGDGEHSLWIKHIESKKEMQLVSKGEPFFMGSTFAPDSRHLYYVVQSKQTRLTSLYRIPIAGGTPVRLKDNLDSPISFSPDGNYIAFIRENKESGQSVLVTARTPESLPAVPDASERRIAIRKLPEVFDYPVWSPDGQYIACSEIEPSSSRARVVVMNASDGTEKFTGPWRWRSVILGLSWLPRRYYVLAFVARGDQEDHFREVWLQRFSPRLFPVGEPLPVTRDLGQHESVSATADGHNVLSVNERAVAALWVWDNEDPHQSKRAPVTAVTRYTMVRWTADGELLYDRIVGDQVHLWLTKPDGSSDRQITFKPNQQMPSPCRASGEVVSVFSTPGQREIRSWNPNLNTSKTLLTGVEHTPPQCSPDGKFVVFTRTAPGRWPSLWRLPVAGRQPVKINDGWSISPAISPDGAYVAAFYSGSPDTLQTPPANIAIIPIQGGKPTGLLNIDRSVVQWAGLRWAPDGKNVSYVDYRDGAANIWIRPISGEPGRRVTDFKADQISSFDWSPDGRKIAFSRVTLSREALLIRDKD